MNNVTKYFLYDLLEVLNFRDIHTKLGHSFSHHFNALEFGCLIFVQQFSFIFVTINNS